MNISTLSLKSKVGLGILLSYTSFEVFMQIRTKYVIHQRHQEIKNFSETKDVNISKFRSASVCGLFINPFDEYRPQTAFEFIVVRIMELFESFYGNKIELHNKLPMPDGGKTEVEDLLTVVKPDLELLRANSQMLQECVNKDDFKSLYSLPSSGWLTNLRWNQVPSLSQQMIFTWLGQSCSLVQISGINLLTDPIISDHLISSSIGPKRLTKSPMTLDDIKYATNNNLSFVLVSHDHPDHLEMNLAKEIGNKTTWIVPLGLKKKLARKGIYKVIEMDWWDSIPMNPYITNSDKLKDKYEIVCVPSMHWSGRYIFDSNRSLWCSFIIKRNGKSILYHAGDTGYSKELFEVIGRKYGPIDLALLPIGQYCPSWHQKPRHISPEESLKICFHLSSKYMMGIHWGTFKLSSEPILEPKNLLQKLSLKLGKSNFYKTPEFGLSYLYNLDTGDEVSLRK